MYTREDIEHIVNKQREFFSTGCTFDVDFRISQLKKLKKAILGHQTELEKALYDDLGRAPFEAYSCDIATAIVEINEMIRGVRKWSRPETHFSGFQCFPSIITKVYKVPYGVAFIMSPFNFPVYLALGVLADSIAGGNTTVIKASAKSARCTEVMKRLIADTFSPEYVTVIDGSHEIADMCLESRFDKIFYTGSPQIGIHVLQCAAKNLTSTCLELGGETGNWCIIRKDADIKDAARKIAFFKALNSGQICINVNQVAVAEEVRDAFLEELKKAFKSQLGESPVDNPEYPRMINDEAYQKCVDISEKYRSKIIFGGVGDRETLKFGPTILSPMDINDDVVKKELFCPILPVVSYRDEDVEKLLQVISQREHGLTMYIFTKNVAWAKKVMQRMQYGGGCINEVCMHMMVKGVPFNGVGHSGMGAYHGKYGFMQFTHTSTVLIGYNKLNMSVREHPYNSKLKKHIFKLLVR